MRWLPAYHPSKQVGSSNWSLRFNPDPLSQFLMHRLFLQIFWADCSKKTQWSASRGSIYASIRSGPRKLMVENYPDNLPLTSIFKRLEMWTLTNLLSSKRQRDSLFQTWPTLSNQEELTRSDFPRESKRTCLTKRRGTTQLTLRRETLMATFSWNLMIKSSSLTQEMTKTTKLKRPKISMIWQLTLVMEEIQMLAFCSKKPLSIAQQTRLNWLLKRTRLTRS